MAKSLMKAIASVVVSSAIALSAGGAAVGAYMSTSDNGADSGEGAPGKVNRKGGLVFTGSGEPSVDLGQDEDSYINTDNWDFYTKADGAWNLEGNIRGEDGPNGPRGVLTGNGLPQEDQGDVGDCYINLVTRDYYVKTENGWGDPIGQFSDKQAHHDGEVHTGEGAPNANQGKPGDTYVDTETGNFYVKDEYGWGEPAGNVKDAQGASEQGEVLTGEGKPAENIGQPGDTYVDTETGETYVKDENGWGEPVENVKPEVYGGYVLTGNSAPTDDLGNGGDCYLNITNGDFYVKTQAGWGDPIGKIDDGRVNYNPVVVTGQGQPNDNIGQPGDTYVDKETGDVYVKDENGWGQPKDNVKDNPGASQQGEVITGQGEPADNIGQPGDTYVDTETGETYVKDENGWGEPVESVKEEPAKGGFLMTGSNAPANDLGKDGDSYINTTNWDYYVKEGDAWVKKGNIEGQRGLSLFTGEVDPEEEMGRVGDSYVNTATGDYFVKNENNEWVLEGNIKGATASEHLTLKTGHGIPDAELGQEGDGYINLDNANFFMKDDQGWHLEGNILTGLPGKGIENIEKQPADPNNPLVDTYVITYDDGSQTSFEVVNGEKGEQGTSMVIGDRNPNAQADNPDTPEDETLPMVAGNEGDSYINVNGWRLYHLEEVEGNLVWVSKGTFRGQDGSGKAIVTIEKQPADPNNPIVDTYRITFSDDSTFDFQVTNGVSIVSVELDDTHPNADPLIDTYIVSYSNGATSTFEVKNGEKGEQGTSLIIGDRNPNAQADNPDTPEDEALPMFEANEGDSYVNVNGWRLYHLEKDANDQLVWVSKGTFRGQDGNGKAITTVEKLPDDPANPLIDTYRITFSDDSYFDYQVMNGNSIVSVELDDTHPNANPLVDTYIITYSNGATSTFEVTNGEDGNMLIAKAGAPDDDLDGQDGDSYIDTVSGNYYVKANGEWGDPILSIKGKGIVSIEKQPADANHPLVDTYRITYSDGDYFDFTVTNAKSIVSITKDHSDQHVDYYVIDYNDGTQSTFTVTNGSSVISGTSNPASNVGLVGDSYVNVTTGDYFVKTDSGWGSAIGNIKGKDGFTILTGTAAPASSLGVVGDSYINTSTGDYYVKESSGWSKKFTIRGNTLITGNGAPTGSPTNTSRPVSEAINGDSYLNLDNWDYYVKRNGSWAKVGNIGLTYTYTVTFDSDGGSTTPASQTVGFHNKVTKPSTDPTKSGYYFLGWGYQDRIWNFNTDVISSDIRLTAIWSKYKAENGVLTGCLETGDVLIPEYYYGQVITSISSTVLKGNTSITSIELPNTVTSIPEGAFQDCTNLKRAILPDSLTSIGKYLFGGCSSLEYLSIPFVSATYDAAIDSNGTNGSIMDFIKKSDQSNTSLSMKNTLKEVVISKQLNFGLATIYNYTCLPVLKTLTLKNAKVLNKASAGNGVFNNGTDYSPLETINLPEGLLTINDSAFYYCRRVKEITIPSTVTHIGLYAFRYMDDLASVTFKGTPTTMGANSSSVIFSVSLNNFKTVTMPISMFNKDGSLFKFNSFIGLVSGSNLRYKLVLTDDGTTILGDGTAHYSSVNKNNVIRRIVLPDTITEIKKNCFIYYNSLTTINMPESLLTIGDSAFAYCVKLTSVHMDDEVTTLGDYIFRDCSALYEIKLSESITKIPAYAFTNCTSLVELRLPSGTTHVDTYAFSNSGLTTIWIPATVDMDAPSYFPSTAFNGCSHLTDIFYAGSKNNVYTSYSNYGLPSSAAGKTVIHCSDGDVKL